AFACSTVVAFIMHCTDDLLDEAWHLRTDAASFFGSGATSWSLSRFSMAALQSASVGLSQPEARGASEANETTSRAERSRVRMGADITSRPGLLPARDPGWCRSRATGRGCRP